MNRYVYTVLGTASGGQAWRVEGHVEVLPGNFPVAIEMAMLDAFRQATQGKAVYGKPGVGCDGPYAIVDFQLHQILEELHSTEAIAALVGEDEFDEEPGREPGDSQQIMLDGFAQCVVEDEPEQVVAIAKFANWLRSHGGRVPDSGIGCDVNDLTLVFRALNDMMMDAMKDDV